MSEEQELEARVTTLEADVLKLKGGHARLSDAIAELGAKIDLNNSMTADIALAFRNAGGFFNTIAWVGKGLILLGKFVVLPVAALYVLVYMTFHHGELPAFWAPLLKLLFG